MRHTHRTYSLSCDCDDCPCLEASPPFVTECEAEDWARAHGWRLTGMEVLCPGCAVEAAERYNAIHAAAGI